MAALPPPGNEMQAPAPATHHTSSSSGGGGGGSGGGSMVGLPSLVSVVPGSQGQCYPGCCLSFNDWEHSGSDGSGGGGGDGSTRRSWGGEGSCRTEAAAAAAADAVALAAHSLVRLLSALSRAGACGVLLLDTGAALLAPYLAALRPEVGLGALAQACVLLGGAAQRGALRSSHTGRGTAQGLQRHCTKGLQRQSSSFCGSICCEPAQKGAHGFPSFQLKGVSLMN